MTTISTSSTNSLKHRQEKLPSENSITNFSSSVPTMGGSMHLSIGRINTIILLLLASLLLYKIYTIQKNAFDFVFARL